MIPLDALRATNLWGSVGPDVQARLAAVVDNPCDATWDDAHSIMVNGATWLTLWQAVLAVDPTFPRVGPTTNLEGKRLRGWPRVPDRDLLLRALRHATGPETARDEALHRVEDHADPDWLTVAERIVRDLPAGTEFTSDSVWERLGDSTPETHEPRALGAVMMRLARRGVIAKTGVYGPSRRKQNHARPIPTWRRV